MIRDLLASLASLGRRAHPESPVPRVRRERLGRRDRRAGRDPPGSQERRVPPGLREIKDPRALLGRPGLTEPRARPDLQVRRASRDLPE